MLKLRNVLHPNAISVLNKIGNLEPGTITVPEQAAYCDLVSEADLLHKNWKLVVQKFAGRTEEPQVASDLEVEWNKELPHLQKLPHSLVEKVGQKTTPNEFMALRDLCEKAA